MNKKCSRCGSSDLEITEEGSGWSRRCKKCGLSSFIIAIKDSRKRVK